jgi:DMSO/TMAO reductase YedYZ heme-binding membrane subunit
MTAIELSSYAGLGAITLLTINILIGLLLATKYNPVRRWPHRHLDTVTLHNWTGWAALALSAVHPVIILFSATAKFGVVDILYPVNAPRQPTINTLGAIALYLLIFVVVTSYFRFQIGRRWWKRMHFVTYPLFVLYAIHAIQTDPNLKDAPIDYLDGEKVYVELCVLLVIVAVGLRVRWQRRQPPARAHRPKPSRAEREARRAAMTGEAA